MALFKKRKIAELPAPPVAELRRRTRILVIDDDPHSFPFDTLRREGYAIDYWAKVENLQTLEEGRYDIIFLDIQGVAQEYSKEDGLGVLEHLKQANPSQMGIGRTNCLVNEPFLGHTPLLATLLASDKEDYVNFRANPSQNPVRGRIVTLNKGKGYGVFVHLF